jgi:hypothetical protein
MKKFLTTIVTSAISFSLVSCDTQPAATSSNQAKTATPTPAPMKTPPGRMLVFLDGLLVVEGLNPIAVFSADKHNFTFYSTFYTPDVINKYSYATFTLNSVTADEIKENVDISDDPNIKIESTVVISPANSPDKAKTTYNLNAGSAKDLTLDKYSGTLKGRLTFDAPKEINSTKDFAKHFVRIEFEFPYEKGQLKTYDPASLEIREGIGFVKP